jgi:hypothetical protein
MIKCSHYRIHFAFLMITRRIGSRDDIVGRF